MLFLFDVDNGGQWCNKLFSLVPSISYAIETKQKLHVFFYKKKYISEFPNIGFQKKLIHFTETSDKKSVFIVLLSKLIVRLCRVLNIEEKVDLRNARKATIQSVDAWNHRHDKAFINKHILIIRSLFKFRPEVYDSVNKHLGTFDGCTIGVHVRKGDYKDWRGGLYYYDNETYINVMLKLKDIFGDKCRFLVCSNEKFEIQADGIDSFQIENASAVLDLCALSMCDYIVGPPSTFSQWASFIGNKPLCYILFKDQIFKKEDFSCIIRHDYFENGKVLKEVPYTERLVVE